MAAESSGTRNQTNAVTRLSNREFLERVAQAGRLGLCGGATPVDLAIRRAQRHVDGAGRWSDWTHAFLFYFTHPGRHGVDAKKDGPEQRRSSLQVVELQMKDGWLNCNRDQPTSVVLLPPD